MTSFLSILLSLAVAAALPKKPLPNVRLVDQDEKAFQLHDLKGKYTFISFLYTNCPSEAACPLTAKLAKNLQEEMVKEIPGADVQFLLVTLDPDRDTPAKLKAFAKARGIDRKPFRLVTGDSASLQQLKEALEVSGTPESDGNFFHDSTSFLVDENMVPVQSFENNTWNNSQVLSYLTLRKK